MATVLASLRRLKRLEAFLIRGGSLLNASKETRTSIKTVRRMIVQLREQGATVETESKGFWRCTHAVLQDPDIDLDLDNV